LFKRILLLLALWVLWITYSKEYLFAYFQPMLGEFGGYMAASLVAFFGSWVTWNLLLRRRPL
jgi:hypothetical protein